MTEDTTQSSKRIAKNTLYLYCRMILITAVSLFTSRVVLEQLGVDDFGTYNVVAGVVTALGFINGPMIESTQRFLNFYMGKKDEDAVRNVFNASFVIHFVIATTIVILAETVGLYFFNQKLVLHPDRYSAAFFAYQSNVISAFVLICSYPYNAAIIAHERMRTFAVVSVIDAFLKLFLAYLISISNYDKLYLYSLLMCLVQIGVALAYIIYSKKKFNETQLRIFSVPSRLYKEMLSFSLWNFWGNFASVCLTQGSNILLNLFFGPAVNAAKGISVQVQNAVNKLCNNFQFAMKPQIIKSYANGNLTYMHTLLFNASRFSFLLTFVLAIPLLWNTEFILNMWLKNVPEWTYDFVQYIIIISLVTSISAPLLTGCVATGNVKKIMAIVATLYILSVPIAYACLLQGTSPNSVFMIQLIIHIIAFFVRVYIVSKEVQFPIKSYAKKVLLPIFNTVSICIIIKILLDECSIQTYISNVLYLLCSFCISICIVLWGGVRRVEREQFFAIIKLKLCKVRDI